MLRPGGNLLDATVQGALTGRVKPNPSHDIMEPGFDLSSNESNSTPRWCAQQRGGQRPAKCAGMGESNRYHIISPVSSNLTCQMIGQRLQRSKQKAYIRRFSSLLSARKSNPHQVASLQPSRRESARLPSLHSGHLPSPSKADTIRRR